MYRVVQCGAADIGGVPVIPPFKRLAQLIETARGLMENQPGKEAMEPQAVDERAE